MTNQFVMLGGQAVLISCLILVLFKLRYYFGLSPLYVTLGVFQPIQVLLASSIYIEIIPGLLISPGTVIMFTASMFAILLVYIRENAVETRKIIYGILIANLAMTFLLLIFGIQVGFSNTLNFLNLPAQMFNQGARVMFSGTITLFIDALLIIFVYEWTGRFIRKILFLRIFITMTLILIIDTLIFATGAFSGQANYTSIIISGIIGKVSFAVFYSILLSCYLYFLEFDEHDQIETVKPFNDIFSALTFSENKDIEIQKNVSARSRINSTLQEQERVISAITETGPAIIYVFDMETNCNIFVNSGLERLLGYPTADIREMGENVLANLIHEDDMQAVFDLHSDIIQAEDDDIFTIEYRMRHRNGQWVMLHSEERVFLRNEDGSVKQKIGVAIDISEQKRVESAVSENERKLTTLLGNLPGIAYRCKNDPDWTMEFMSEGCKALTGYDSSEIENNKRISFAELIHPNDRQPVWDAIQKAVKDKTSFQINYRIHTSDLQEKWVMEQGQAIFGVNDEIIALEGFISDITERTKAEEALLENERNMENAEKMTKSGNWYWNVNTGEVRWSEGTYRIFGVDKETFIPDIDSVMNQFHPADRETHTNLIADAISNHEPITFEARILLPDNSIRHLISIAEGTYDENDNLSSIFGTVQDITDRKKAEADIRESESKLNAVVNNTEDSIWSLDRDYKYIFFNKAYSDIFFNSYGVELKYGMDAKGFLKPEEYDFWVPLFESAYAGTKQIFEFSHEFDGIPRYFQTSLNPIYKDGIVTGVSAMSVDITSVKETEKAIILSNKRYTSLFNESPVPLWEEDLTEIYSYLLNLKKTGINDLQNYFITNPGEMIKCAKMVNILDVNQAVLDLYDAECKGQLFGNLDKSFTEKSYDVFLEELLALADGKVAYESEAEVKTLNGELKYIYLKLKIDRSQEGKVIALSATTDISERRKAEQLIKLSEYNFRSIFEESTDGIMLLDDESRPLEINNKICEMLNYSREELSAINATTLLHPEDRKGIDSDSSMQLLKDGKTIYSAYRLKRKDGSYIKTEVSTKRLDENRNLNIIRDITEREKAVDIIKSSNERLRFSTEGANIGTWHWDLTSGEILSSKKCNALFGLAENESFNYEIFRNSIFPDDRERADRAIRIALDNHSDYDIEHRVLWKDGSIHWLAAKGRGYYDASGRELRMEGIVLDIQERKNAEAALQQQAEELILLNKLTHQVSSTLSLDRVSQIALDGIEESIVADLILFFLIDGENLKLVNWKSVNPDFKTSDFTAHRVGDCLCGLSVIEGKPIYSRNIMIDLRCSGEECKALNIQSLAAIPMNSADEIIGVVAFGSAIEQDYIRQKRFIETLINEVTVSVQNSLLYEKVKLYSDNLEQLVAERTEELELTNKELEAFAYSISHDLRAPLRAINGFMQIFLQDYVEKMDDEGKRIGSVIQKNSQKMGQLIDDLLTFSRLGRISMNVSNIDMKNMVQEIYNDLTSEEQRLKIEFSIEELPVIKGDPSLLRQVWINLISNAVKFSSKRPIIKISVTFIDEIDNTVFCIKDNGAGFNMEYKEQLFGVFQRLHNVKEFEGTGVGLALVKRIVMRHKGEVWAEGKEDSGAAFYFSIPK